MPDTESDAWQAEALRAEANAIAGWLQREFLPEPLPELLDDAEKLRQADKWGEATDKYRLFLEQTQALDSIEGRIGTYGALAHVYLGAVYYAQNDFVAASAFFKQADKAFADTCYRRNRAVVTAARGLIHLRRGEKAQANVCYQQALGILGESDVRAKVKDQWKKTSKLLEEAREKAARARAVQAPTSPDRTSPKKRRFTNREDDMAFDTRKTDSPPVRAKAALKWLIGIAGVIAALGLIVATALGGKDGLIAYVIAFIVATIGYVIASFTQTPCDVPSDSFAVIEGIGEPKVVSGPTRYYRWLFIQSVRAVVPRRRFQYISPKQTITLKSGASADISLAVRFGVGHLAEKNAVDQGDHDMNATTGPNKNIGAVVNEKTKQDPHKKAEEAVAEELPFKCRVDDRDVLRSVYAVQDMAAKGGTADRKAKILMPGDLRSLWQKKLSDDVKMTLYAILSGKYESKELDEQFEEIEVTLTRDLNARAYDWGICVEEVRIADLVKSKK